jgi:hypothetical protein
MLNLLITTPWYFLRYNVENRQTFIIEDNRREYYGISWFKNEDNLYLSHSFSKNDKINTLEDYALSETGAISRGVEESWRFLSAPHQILCINDHVLATNTGRNSLSVINKSDWAARQYHYSRARWDRYGADVIVGNHLNSIFCDDQYLYVLASNFNNKSFIIKIDPDNFKSIDIINCPSSYMHNLWVQDRNNIISCDTMNAGLLEIKNNKPLWKCPEEEILTRGLAATEEVIFVGASQRTQRDSRPKGETGIWTISNSDFKTIDYHHIGNFGGVHEVRVVGARDICHDNGIMLLNQSIIGIPLQEYLSNSRMNAISKKKYGRRIWDIAIGDIDCANESEISSFADGICIALMPEIVDWNTIIHGTLDVSDPSADFVALVTRYVGPNDGNMLIALLQRNSAVQSRMSLWQNHNDEWLELSHVYLNDLIITIDFIANEQELSIVSDGKILLCATCTHPTNSPGKVGIRIFRGSVSEFSYKRHC